MLFFIQKVKSITLFKSRKIASLFLNKKHVKLFVLGLLKMVRSRGSNLLLKVHKVITF